MEIDRFRRASDRFDRILTISVANTLFKVAKQNNIDDSIVMIMASFTFLFFKLMYIASSPKKNTSLDIAMHLTILVFTRTLVSKFEFDPQKQSVFSIGLHFAILTIVVMIVGDIVRAVLPDDSKKFIVSMQFVFLDTIKHLLKYVLDNLLVNAVLSIALYVLRDTKTNNKHLNYVKDTTTVSVLDILVGSMLPKQVPSYWIDVDAIARLCMVILLDNILRSSMPMDEVLQNTRSYILWQLSYEFEKDINGFETTTGRLTIIVVCFLFGSSHNRHLQTLADLSALVAINVLLGYVSTRIETSPDGILEGIGAATALQIISSRLNAILTQH